MKKLLYFLTGFLMLLSTNTRADEGMWIPLLVDRLNYVDMQEMGLNLTAEEIYSVNNSSLKDAIVIFGGGCTGEIISADGLLITNHHCGYGVIQSHSTIEHDYLSDGFWAMSREEELVNPGLSVRFLERIEDVTERVLAGLNDGMTEDERKEKIKEIGDEIKAEATGDTHYNASVRSFFRGNEYYLFVYEIFKDVRLVGAPPSSIGKYGADTDNWMWPRHTGDFAYARVYVSTEGVGRKYHEDNIPYQPKKWLKISTRNLNDGDFTMIMGFPGRTSRYRTSYSVKYNRNYFYPDWLTEANDIINILDITGADSPEATMAVAGLRKGIANYQKKYGGTVAVMDKFNYLNQTIDNEIKFIDFVKSNRKLKKKYSKVLDKIGNLYSGLIINKKHDDILNSFFSKWSGTLPSVASNLYYFAKEGEKSDSERDPKFSKDEVEKIAERLHYRYDVERFAERLHFRYMGYYEPAHKELLKYYINKTINLPINNRVAGIDELLSKKNMTPSEFVDFAFNNTKLTDVEYTKSLFKLSSNDLEQLNDPFIELAVTMYKEYEIFKRRSEKFNAEITDLRQKYIEALQLMNDEAIYPDANSSFRFTYGDVEGYSPRDAVQYAPFTTLGGAIEKDTGESPFYMPTKLKELYKARDYGNWADPDLNDMPIAFLHTTDITNGNSGSPVL
ncbi:MAG: S46 family peptidase, partial [Bacteroidales bacterium]|nr:S46 family peptidase [Bacteroidales bacterium]